MVGVPVPVAQLVDWLIGPDGLYQRMEGAPTYRRGFEPRRFNPMRSGYQPRNVCTLKMRSSSRALVVVHSKPARLLIAHLPKQPRQPSFFIPHNQLISTLPQFFHSSSITHRPIQPFIINQLLNPIMHAFICKFCL